MSVEHKRHKHMSSWKEGGGRFEIPKVDQSKLDVWKEIYIYWLEKGIKPHRASKVAEFGSFYASNLKGDNE